MRFGHAIERFIVVSPEAIIAEALWIVFAARA